MAGSTVFAFGKHKGRSFLEVAQDDAGYCEWALKMEKPSGALQDFVTFLHSRGMKAAPRDEAARPGFGGKPARSFGDQSEGWNARTLPTPLRSQGLDRLGDQTTLVCELHQEGRFSVRAERAASLPQRPGAQPDAASSAYVPPHLWTALGNLQGATLSSDRRAWTFPLANYDAVLASLDGIGQVEPIPQWVLQMAQTASKALKAECDLDADKLPPRLLPYQLEGVRFGVSRGGRCLIGDEMGLGKTLQALALAAQYWQEWPVLVICPSSLRWVWKEQAEEWLPELNGDEVQVIKKGSDSLDPLAKFWIISYTLLASDKSGKFQQRPDGRSHEIVIADESHNIKEWTAVRTKAVVPLLRKAKRAVLLSGTPTRNSPDELHPQLCGLLSNMPAKYGEFRARYCVQQQQQVAGRILSKVAGARNTAELNYLLMATVMVRRLKKDVLSQLPPKRRQRIPIEVTDARALKEIRGEMQELSGVFDGNMGGEAVSTLFLKIAKAKLPAVKEYLLEVLERGDEKAIVFAHHKLMLDAISDLLTKQLGKDGLTHVRIDGGTPAAKRPELVKQFQEDPSCRIALLSITACAEGLTLTAAGLVIFAELYWVPGAVEQAEARAHRIGTTHTKVVVEFLVVPNSPDEYIYNSLERKKKDTSRVLDGAAESLGAARQVLLPRKRASPEASSAGAPADGSDSAPRKRPTVRPMASVPAPPSAPATGEGAAVSASAPASAPSLASASAHAPAASQASQPDAMRPPVDQAKVDFLLRAVRESASRKL